MQVTGAVDRQDVEVVEVDPASDEVRIAQQRYVDELATVMPDGFDPGPVGHDDERYRPPGGSCLVARVDGRTVGTVSLKWLEPDDGDEVATPVREVKRMWVDGSTRGHGVGRRLLEAVEQRARELGTATLRLDTNGRLEVALALYASAGYEPTPAYNDNPYATHFLQRSLQ